MSLDGAGTYQPPAPFFPAIPDTTILSNDFNQIILDIAAALSQAIFRDGQAAFTADQSMGSRKLTNLANGVNPQDATTVLQVFTDPNFTATSPTGLKVTGTAVTISVTKGDFSGSTQILLPANTSIGTVSAAELAVLDGLTVSTAELNTLDGITANVTELNILTGLLTSTAELNRLQGVASNVQSQLNALDTGKAGLSSPAFTGTPTAPTAAPGTSTTQLATTAFVLTQAMNSALPYQLGNAGKFITTDGSVASWVDLIVTKYITTTQTLKPNIQYNTDTSAGPFAVIMPVTPGLGDPVYLIDTFSTWGSANLILTCSDGNTINGSAANFALDVSGASVTLIYKSGNWSFQ